MKYSIVIIINMISRVDLLSMLQYNISRNLNLSVCHCAAYVYYLSTQYDGTRIQSDSVMQ